MAKNTTINAAGLFTPQDIQAWFIDNPYKLGTVDDVMPLEFSEEETWKTQSNASYMLNEAASPTSGGSPVPVSGRPGFKDIMGGMIEFSNGREMDSKELERYDKLKQNFAKMKNATAAKQLVDFYGNDLAYLRTSMHAERMYLTYALLSNACNIDLVAANSPYMQGLVAMQYPIESWQKNNVATAWSNPASLILDDIQSVLDTCETNGKVVLKIKINKKWFGYVRNNTQVQKYCATLIQNITSAQSAPNKDAVNAMLANHFDSDVMFEVVDEKITRESTNGVKTTANPFADGVAVFTASTRVGRFLYNDIYIDDATRETHEDFFLVGNYKKVDPSENKMYTKAKGFPVVDTYADNFYLKINAVAW